VVILGSLNTLGQSLNELNRLRFAPSGCLVHAWHFTRGGAAVLSGFGRDREGAGMGPMGEPARAQPQNPQHAGLVARYRYPLIRYFARRGIPAPLCEDLAHDTFTRLFILKDPDRILNVEAYLFQIAAKRFH